MTIDRWFGIAIAFVVLHFFLFCNVLRMSRPLELIWAGIFAALAIAIISFNLLSWPAVFAISGAATMVVATFASGGLLTEYCWAMVCWIAFPPVVIAWLALRAHVSRRVAMAG